MDKTQQDLIRRQELIYMLYSNKDSLQNHATRIRFEINKGNLDSLVGALTDYFICTKANDYLQRQDFIKESLHKLSQDWLLLFFDYLRKDFLPTTPIPYNRWSIFTEDVQGIFSFIDPL